MLFAYHLLHHLITVYLIASWVAYIGRKKKKIFGRCPSISFKKLSFVLFFKNVSSLVYSKSGFSAQSSSLKSVSNALAFLAFIDLQELKKKNLT